MHAVEERGLAAAEMLAPLKGPVNVTDCTPRSLPKWAWIMALLLYPTGMFVAYGSARLLSWRRSVSLAVLSWACVFGFVQLMIYLEFTGAGYLARSVALSVGALMVSAWGKVLFRIGEAASYWSPVARRCWRCAGWLAAAVVLLSVIEVMLGTAAWWLGHA